MYKLAIRDRPEGLRLLFIGAHCDDIEIGCGATILRVKEEWNIQHIKWIIFTSNVTRAQEAKATGQRFLEGVRSHDITVHDGRDGHLPFAAELIKGVFEQMKDYHPDIIFTHARHDRHQDHRLLAEMTWNTFRDHVILEYEVPKFEGDLRQPNVFFIAGKDTATRKANMIVEGFPSQSDKQWFDVETFLSLMRIRGVECASPTGYAEGFYVSKLTI